MSSPSPSPSPNTDTDPTESVYSRNYSGFGRRLGADPSEGDHGFDTSNLPFGVRPSRPFNRDINTWGQVGQDPAYLANPDAAAQADNVREGDIDGLPIPELQREGAETWNDYHERQRQALDNGTEGVGTGG